MAIQTLVMPELNSIAAMPAKIQAAEYRQRRSALMQAIGMNSVALISAASLTIRNNDVAYPLRQNSDFRYLIDFDEADAVLLLAPNQSNSRGGDCILFCHQPNEHTRLWDGDRFGATYACEHSGMDDAFDLADIDVLLPQLLAGREQVHYNSKDIGFAEKIRSWINAIAGDRRGLQKTPDSMVCLSRTLHEMRLLKTTTELALMRHAGAISMQAHIAAMRQSASGVAEYQLEATLNYHFAHHGAKHWAYPAIVASGANACILHYTANHALLSSGASVLIDAGCEIEGYASDISRSFAVQAPFNKLQLQIYNAIYQAQEAAIKTLKPGNTVLQAHEAALTVLAEALRDWGLLSNTSKKADINADIKETARRFMPHRTSHWLGLDVHDVGGYAEADGSSRRLCAGMVLTVEPGLYFQMDDQTVPKHWRGIGMRLEDDVVITAQGAKIINPRYPATATEIEAVQQGA